MARKFEELRQKMSPETQTRSKARTDEMLLEMSLQEIEEPLEGFGPQTQEEERIFAEENFRIDVQMTIQELMEKKGVNQKQLATLLGVTESRVSQFFTDESDMTLRELAGILHALHAFQTT